MTTLYLTFPDRPNRDLGLPLVKRRVRCASRREATDLYMACLDLGLRAAAVGVDVHLYGTVTDGEMLAALAEAGIRGDGGNGTD